MGLADRLRELGGKPPPFKARPELLLLPNVPKPLHGVAPRMVLGRKWWDETRREAYRSTGYRCAACGVTKWEAKEHRWLEGHEVYDVDYLLGRMTYLETVPLCHYCHNFIHCGRLEALVAKREITRKKYKAILAHGRAVLRSAKLRKRQTYSGPTAEWGEWRLVVGEREFKPLYRTYEEWAEKYAEDE